MNGSQTGVATHAHLFVRVWKASITLSGFVFRVRTGGEESANGSLQRPPTLLAAY